ncbi:MAG: type II toxin-antitoxin system prevent-host-death family antitoxin [Bryobacterales bacterium]|nr:type II toxin-antitoxin system prevent-host-death family antitoxin [Bryobacterales bacterium]
MEIGLREAKARLSALVTAVQNGERVVITKRGQPAVEIVRCPGRGGIDFDKLAAARELVGLAGDGERWPQEFNDPALSRRLLGLDG